MLDLADKSFVLRKLVQMNSYLPQSLIKMKLHGRHAWIGNEGCTKQKTVFFSPENNFLFKLNRELCSHGSVEFLQVSVMSSVSFLLYFLHVLPFRAALVALSPLLPVPHLFAVLVQAKVWAAKDLDVVFVSQPWLSQ